MNEHFFQILIPSAGLLSGLIATYVSLQSRAFLAEVRQEMAQMESRIIEKLNGKYVRQSECLLREELLQDRLRSLMDEMRNKNAAGHARPAAWDEASAR